MQLKKAIDGLKDIFSQWLRFNKTEPEKKEQQKNIDVPADLSQMRSFADGDIAAEKELAGLFIRQSDLNIQALHDNRNGTDEEAWREAAHMMKGGAGGIGAFTLKNLCKEAQDFSGNAAERDALYNQILTEYKRVKAYIRSIGLLD